MPAAWRYGCDGLVTAGAAAFAVHDDTVAFARSFTAGCHRMTSSLLRTLALSLWLATPKLAAAVIGRRWWVGYRCWRRLSRWAHGSCDWLRVVRNLLSIERLRDASLELNLLKEVNLEPFLLAPGVAHAPITPWWKASTDVCGRSVSMSIGSCHWPTHEAKSSSGGASIIRSDPTVHWHENL